MTRAMHARSQVLGETWLEPEELAYPSGGFGIRRAYVVLRQNPHNPIMLDYGKLATVLVSIPDTFSTIPARLRTHGQRIKGYVSVDTGSEVFTFTPEADPNNCVTCVSGQGCKQ